MIDSHVIDCEKMNETLKSYENETNNILYHSMVDRITEHPKLLKWIEKKVDKDKIIMNLVTKDWLSVLKNNPIFQEFLNSNIQYFKYDSPGNKAIINYKVKDYSKYIHLIVVGTFKLEEEEQYMRLKFIDCIPIQCIGEIMSLNINKNILPNAKFFMKGCNGLCLKCRDLTMVDNKWCIQNCMVYQGEKLQSCTRDYYESAYPDNVKAIVQLEINSVYSFGDKCKIGGIVKNMINTEDIFNNTDDSIEGLLILDDNFVPSENKSDVEQFNKRINEGGESRELKHLKETNTILAVPENDTMLAVPKTDTILTVPENDTILAIPKRVQYIKSKPKQYEVITSVKPMPDV